MKQLPKLFITTIFVITALGCNKEKKIIKAAAEMQKFVIKISEYAKAQQAGFNIIPQNGIELIYTDADSSNSLKQDYINAIDGVGMEELFYNTTLAVQTDKINRLQKIKTTKRVISADFVGDDNLMADAVQRNLAQGFVPYPRNKDNYDYKIIQPIPANENNSNITSLDSVKNCLYQISTDNYATKEDFINAIAATNYDLVLIDLFFSDEAFTTAETNRMKIKANGSKRLLISYINIGAAEKYRYYYKKRWIQHFPGFLKKKYDGYSDEIWVKYWKQDWQDIIYGNDDSYIKKIINAGFDGAYLDNVEAYYFLYEDE